MVGKERDDLASLEQLDVEIASRVFSLAEDFEIYLGILCCGAADGREAWWPGILMLPPASMSSEQLAAPCFCSLRAGLFPHQLGIKICGSVNSGPLKGEAFCIRKVSGQRLGLGSRDVVMAGIPPTLPKWES